MKILHTADWHLDAPLQGHGEYLRQALASVPGTLLELCREEGCEVVLIAGDVFDGGSGSSGRKMCIFLTLPRSGR